MFFVVFRAFPFFVSVFVSQWYCCLHFSCPVAPSRSACLARYTLPVPCYTRPLFVVRSFVVRCYQLTPTLALPLTFQRCSRRLLLFLPSAVECRGRGREKDDMARIIRDRDEAKGAQLSTHTLSPPLNWRRVEMRESISSRANKEAGFLVIDLVSLK